MDLIYTLAATMITACLFKYGMFGLVDKYLSKFRYYYWMRTITIALNSRIKTKMRDYIVKNWIGDRSEVIRHPHYLDISYIEKGKNKRIFVPLKLEQSLVAMQCEINIIYNESLGEQLKQDDDIPIMVTANDLGAKHVQVSNRFTGMEKIFKGADKIEYFA